MWSESNSYYEQMRAGNFTALVNRVYYLFSVTKGQKLGQIISGGASDIIYKSITNIPIKKLKDSKNRKQEE